MTSAATTTSSPTQNSGNAIGLSVPGIPAILTLSKPVKNPAGRKIPAMIENRYVFLFIFSACSGNSSFPMVYISKSTSDTERRYLGSLGILWFAHPSGRVKSRTGYLGRSSVLYLPFSSRSGLSLSARRNHQTSIGS
ncbi:hypothetical protein EDB65_102282 [Vibrio crassostreae]|nr:hypothetical protein EDB65_102282 [Vibrio crassostreae]